MKWINAEELFIRHRIIIKGWPKECVKHDQVPGPNYNKRSLKVTDFRIILEPLLDWEDKGGFSEEKWEKLVGEAKAKKDALEIAVKEGRTLDYTEADCIPSMSPILRVVPWSEGTQLSSYFNYIFSC